MSEWSCFVLMPFADEFDDVYLLIRDLSTVDALSGLTLLRADDISEPGRITDQVIAAIQKSDFVIADVSRSNPNVMFELGYARALGKPAVILNQDIGDSPFDIAEMRQVVYDRTRLVGDLKPQLISAVQAVVARLLRLPAKTPARAEGSDANAPKAESEPERAEREAAQLTQSSLSLQDAIVKLEAIEMEVDLYRGTGATVELQRLTKELKGIVDRVDVSHESPDALMSLSSELGDLASSLHNASLHREAEDLFNRAMSLGVQHPGVHLQYALFVALHKHDYQKALALFDRAEHLGVDSERLARARAQYAGARAMLASGGNVDDSLTTDIRRMYEAHPDSWEVFASYIALLKGTGNYDQIETICTERLKASGDDPANEDTYRVMRVWADILAVAKRRDRAEQAADVYRRILHARQDDADVLSNLATLIFEYGASTNEKKECLSYYTRAYRIRPDDHTIRRAFSRATAQLTGRRELAVKILKGQALESELASLPTFPNGKALTVLAGGAGDGQTTEGDNT